MQNRGQFWQKSAEFGMKLGRWLFDRYRVGLHPQGQGFSGLMRPADGKFMAGDALL